MQKNKQCFKHSIYLLVFMFSFFILSGSCDAEVHKDAVYEKHLNHFLALKQAKKYSKAEKVISTAILRYPNVAQLYYCRGKLRHTFFQNYQAAIKDYSKTIALDPKSIPKSYWRRGYCLYSIGQYKLAIRDYSNCLKLIPNYPKVYLMRAKAFAKLGMVAEAVNDLHTVMKQDPKYNKVAQNLMNKILSGENNF